MHLLDATMFWNPVDGARRYIAAKHHWARRTAWRHTIVTGQVGEPGIRSVPSLPLPGSHGEIRLPWSRHASTRVLCRARPDIIEAGDPYRLAWSALDAAQTLGVPSVAFCHSNPEHLAGFTGSGSLRLWAQRAARRYAAHLYRQFDLVLAPSMAMANHLRDWGLTRVVHQPLGVDGQVFHPARRNSPWREALDLPPDARLLVYTGRFGAEKNLATLVAATEMLGPRYWLLAVGAGPMVPSGPRVLVLPTIHRSAPLATVLASCDVFVHAGRHETFGLPALEAMACGLPVVCSQAEGLGELVDETVGRGVEGSSPEDFAVAIADVFKRDRAVLARAARERALSHAWPRVLPLLWGHYRRLVGLNTRTCPERGLLQAR